MSASFSKLKNHFAGWRSWELNPVVVKELRQAVRSWAVTGMLLLFLVILFCTALSVLVTQSFRLNTDLQIGGRIFGGFLVILTGASFAFIPLYVGVRMAAERQESNLDLLYITTLTPGRIIRGKFFCGAYMTLLFFSACMPFMVFTNLLRGVDLPTIFFILFCLFLAVCAAVQTAIFLACLPISKLLKILVALMGTLAAFIMIRPLIELFFYMMRSGVGSMIGVADFRMAFASAAGAVLACGLLLYYLSVALISPLSANRALPVRTYLTFLWILFGAICYFWVRKLHDARPMLPWAVISYVLFAAALLVVVSNQDVLSLRVRRRIPLHPAKRPPAFLFYNGAAGGLVWLGLLTAITFAVTSQILRHPPASLRPALPMTTAGGTPAFPSPVPEPTNTLPEEQLFDFEIITGTLAIYSFAYALTALFLHRQFFPRRSPKLAGVLTLFLPAAWALVPNIVFFFLNRLTWTSIEQSQLGNMFNIFVVKNWNQKVAHLVCASAWLLLMVLLNAKWFIHQLRHFQPSRRSDSLPVTTESPATISTAVK